MIVIWFIRVKYKISVLLNQCIQKGIIFFLPLFRNPKPILILVDLPPQGDPNIGKKLSDGLFIFSSVLFDLDVDNPWLIEPPSKEVEIYIHGFCWLNDLSAHNNSISRRLALEWLKKWNFYNSFSKKLGWEPEVTALRCINILRNWKFLTGGLEKIDSQYLKTLRQQYIFLRLVAKTLRPNLKKLNVLYANFLLARAYDLSERVQKKILKQLCKVILQHINIEGQVSSRDPQELLTCFIMINEILKVSKSKELLSDESFKILNTRIEAIAPVLRGLRLGNGFLTRSHGGDIGAFGLMDRYLVESGVKTKPKFTKLLGFERITAGRLTLIVDCAKPISGIMGDNSHASCLSFELTSGQRPIFVNCGPGGRFGTAFHRYCRSTKAHNSCTLENISQSEFKFISKQKRWPREIIIRGPKNVGVKRHKTFEATWLELSHDSYETKYGYTHFRKLLVLNSGKVFSGTDIFKINDRTKKQLRKVDNFYAYFQLHPDVELWDDPKLQTIILRLKNGEHWIFEIDFGQVTVEDSAFINSFNSEPENTKRIVIKSSTLLNNTEIKWSLRRREIVNRNTRDSGIVK